MIQRLEMTSLPDVVTSESPDVNTTIGFYVTVAATSTKGLAGHVSPSAVPMIAMVAILLTLAIVNLCGNGFTLITIRMTPRLWTKTNFILASMLLSDFITVLFLICVNILLVSVLNNPCRLNVIISGLTILMYMPIYVSIFHTILVSVERYIAIVFPLRYETTFTDRTLKLAIFTIWMIGIFMGMTFALWLINADLRKCILIPVHCRLIDVVVYVLICILLFICYGKILAIARHQNQRIEPQPATISIPASVPSIQTTMVATVTQSSRATTSNNTRNRNDKSLTGIGAPSEWAVTIGTAASSEVTRKQQRQKIRFRRREFKAVYLTAAIVGTFVVLSFPLHLGRVLESVHYNPVVTGYIIRVGGAMGACNFSFTWAIYAAVSKSYRRAYRQMLIRIGCCCCKNVTLPADSSPVVQNSLSR